jgi:hypothetical protein
MPFISTLRRKYDGPKTGPSTLEQFKITGGDAIITAGGYRIHMFTSPGDAEFVVQSLAKQAENTLALQTASINVEYFVLAGGGGGGPRHGGGGGGAGGYRESTLSATAGTSPVTVGANGIGQYFGNPGTPGANSVFGSITSIGGGQGAGYHDHNSSPGGSGGGGGGPQVNAHRGGGGGGAGGAGTNCGPTTNPGNSPTVQGTPGQGNPGGFGHNDGGGFGGTGGPGSSSSITGSAVTRAGGGGGASWVGSPSPGGPGGGGPASPSGGGGDGNPATGSNTGSGGGGGNGNPTRGGDGTSGLVVVRYLI